MSCGEDRKEVKVLVASLVLGSGLTVQLERVVGVPGLAGLDRLLGLMLVTRCLHAMSCIQDRSQSFSISYLRKLCIP